MKTFARIAITLALLFSPALAGEAHPAHWTLVLHDGTAKEGLSVAMEGKALVLRTAGGGSLKIPAANVDWEATWLRNRETGPRNPVLFKSGMKLAVVGFHKRENRTVLILDNGTVLSVPASLVDYEATVRARDRDHYYPATITVKGSPLEEFLLSAGEAARAAGAPTGPPKVPDWVLTGLPLAAAEEARAQGASPSKLEPVDGASPPVDSRTQDRDTEPTSPDPEDRIRPRDSGTRRTTPDPITRWLVAIRLNSGTGIYGFEAEVAGPAGRTALKGGGVSGIAASFLGALSELPDRTRIVGIQVAPIQAPGEIARLLFEVRGVPPAAGEFRLLAASARGKQGEPIAGAGFDLQVLPAP